MTLISNKKQKNFSIIRKGSNREFDLNIANIASSILNELKNNYLVVTGVKEGVGVSSIVLALGETLSEYKKVLLIEANFIAPSYSKNGVGNDIYFDDFLSGKIELENAINHINNNLDVMVINGNANNSKARINLTNGSFNEKLNSIKKNYDLILVDAPSVDIADDAINLAKYTKEIALVIEARTSRKALKKAVNMIDCANVNLLGLIINKKHKKNIYS